MAKDIKTYYEQSYIDNTLRLRDVLTTLPPFVKDYFRAIEPTTSAKTRISYAYDLRVFFNFLIENNPVFEAYETNHFTYKDLENLEPIDIEEYLDYLKVYVSPDDKQITNTERGLARKFSSLSSFYRYLFRHKYIVKNPTIFVDKPKVHEKAIIRLDIDEVAMLLDYVETCGNELTGQKKVYYEKTKTRDIAILTLLLGTGIRVSELVGLDIDDVDFKNDGMESIIAGGKATLLAITENGFGKRTELDEYRVQIRGGKGVVTYKITPKTGKLVGARIATDDEDVMLITDTGTIIRLKVKDISILGRPTQGVTLMRTTDGGKVVSIETLTPEIAEVEEGE